MKNVRNNHSMDLDKFIESKRRIPILEKGCEYLSVNEYSDFMGKHPVTINKWLNNGKIEGAVKAGGEWRIPVKKVAGSSERDILSLISKQTEQAEALIREFGALADAIRKITSYIGGVCNDYECK